MKQLCVIPQGLHRVRRSLLLCVHWFGELVVLLIAAGDRRPGQNRSFVLALLLVAVVSMPVVANSEQRPVTFSVDMSVQLNLGRFDPSHQNVQLRGSFNGSSPETLVVTEEGDSVYSGTFSVAGEEDELSWYLVEIQGPTSSIPDRVIRIWLLGPAQQLQTLPTHYFGDIGPDDLVFVHVSVDMKKQVYEGRFDPETSGVVVVGDWGFGEEAVPLERISAGTIYSGTVAIGVLQGSSAQVNYRFCATGMSALGCEDAGPRTVALESDDESVSVPTVYFNDEPPPPIVEVTFLVDMGALISKRVFDPETMGVSLDLSSFPRTPSDGWTALRREGDSAIYSGSLLLGVAPDEGLNVFYGFCVMDGGTSWCETSDSMRNVVFEAGDQSAILGPVYFNDELPRISSLSSTPGPLLTIRAPLGHEIDAVYGADLVLVDGAWFWNLLDPGEDYTLENGEVVLSPGERQVLRFEVRRAE